MLKKAAQGGERGEQDEDNHLYLGMGLGLVVGVISARMMRPRRKNVKSAVARVIGDVADSVSKNMDW